MRVVDSLLILMPDTAWNRARFPARPGEFLAPGTPLVSSVEGESRRTVDLAGHSKSDDRLFVRIYSASERGYPILVTENLSSPENLASESVALVASPGLTAIATSITDSVTDKVKVGGLGRALWAMVHKWDWEQRAIASEHLLDGS
jgi:hypothetical protein